MNLLRCLYASLLHFIFPKRCLVCGLGISAICEDCLGKILKNPRVLKIEKLQVYYLYDFKHPTIHRALWQAKYHADLEILEILGKSLGKEISKNFGQGNNFLIPVPLSNNDTRLHNHALILARSTGFEVADILEKTTVHKQARLSHRQERTENIKDKILINQKKFSKFLQENNLSIENLSTYNFILIDDTVTTGSTLLEAQKALLTKNIEVRVGYTLAH